MLEIRNVTKTYRSKTGESVKALDNISISFPESGMVFILGKSGSGKSTLLNAIGGLDSIDSGEFIIMGKSSKNFVGSDFDAYRNTFIGFIFQEYNVLDEFTVGANIALALELQGKKATDEQINKILAQVDLLSFAKRKPNELSGGQKQRVAIARALVKEPQIIMADEPTGALDSNTGKQIFDTLKELSKEKLVLIVSHDRDFAERYADRIVELADGHIISDVTKHEVEGKTLNDGIRQVSRHILQIKGGYRLTPADVEMINNYLATSPEGVILSGDNRVNGELRSAAGITEDGGTTVFETTDAAKDVKVKEYDGKKTKFIRSRLPIKNAVKIGASGLKYKKFRLFMTILLSLVAFGMFGLADTMAAYNKITAATSSIMDSHVTNASFSLGVRVTYDYDGNRSYYFSGAAMNDEDLKTLFEKTGLRFYPVYNGSSNSGGGYGSGFDVSGMMASNDYQCVAYEGKLYGFTALNAEDISAAGLTLTGRMPEAKNEIVITEFLFRQFQIAGFYDKETGGTVAKNQLTKTTDGAANSIIGKHLSVAGGGKYGIDSTPTSYTVVGVVDTHFDYDRYADFLPGNKNTITPDGGGNNIAGLLLQAELSDTLRYGFHTLGFLTSEKIAELAETEMDSGREYGTYISFGGSGAADDGVWLVYQNGEKNEYFKNLDRMGGSELLSALNVTWLEGHNSLGANEYLVHENALEQLFNNANGTVEPAALDAKAEALFGAETFAKAKAQETENGSNYMNLLHNLAWNEGLSEEDLRAAFLPVLAGMYGLEIKGTTPEGAKNLLWEQLSGFNLGAEGKEGYRFESVRNLYLNWYCYGSIVEDNLLSNADFLAIIRAQHGDIDKMSDTEKLDCAVNAYFNYLIGRQGKNVFGTETYRSLNSAAIKTYLKLIGTDESTLYSSLSLSVKTWNYDQNRSETLMQHEWKLVGTFSGNYNSELIVSDTFVTEAREWFNAHRGSSATQTTAQHEDGYWAFAIAAMPKDRAAVEKLVRLSYDETGDLRFSMQNQVMFTLDNFNSFIEVGAKVFLYIGIGFAVFSSLLLMNFISVSISYKKREIGILRAVGARSSDVFKIFFSESLIIALINYALAILAVLYTIFRINRWMYSEGIRVTLLNFGVRQLALMLLISVAVAALASFLPVWRIARKKPVDAIKNR